MKNLILSITIFASFGFSLMSYKQYELMKFYSETQGYNFNLSNYIHLTGFGITTSIFFITILIVRLKSNK